MKDLILIGGAKGVGKTTLLEALNKMYSVPLMNTGDIVVKARECGSDPEEEVYNFLMGEYSGMVDTHFVGYQGKGFVRALSREHLLSINQKKTIDLVLIDLDLDTVLKRRLKDPLKERIYSPEHTARELERSRYFFKKYCGDLNVPGIVIINNNREDSIKRLTEILYGN